MNGPILWYPLLSALSRADPDIRFVVVGGAVRDYALGLAPKDIDVAVPLNSLDDIDALIEAIDELPEFDGTKLLEFEQRKAYEETLAGVLVGVIETNYTFNDVVTPVQIICRPAFAGGPLQGVSQFDWGILQCWWEIGTVNIGRTDLAASDLADMAATLTQRDAGLVARSLERFWSFDRRNPDLLVPRYKDGAAIPKQEELDL